MGRPERRGTGACEAVPGQRGGGGGARLGARGGGAVAGGTGVGGRRAAGHGVGDWRADVAPAGRAGERLVVPPRRLRRHALPHGHPSQRADDSRRLCRRRARGGERAGLSARRRGGDRSLLPHRRRHPPVPLRHGLAHHRNVRGLRSRRRRGSRPRSERRGDDPRHGDRGNAGVGPARDLRLDGQGDERGTPRAGGRVRRAPGPRRFHRPGHGARRAARLRRGHGPRERLVPRRRGTGTALGDPQRRTQALPLRRRGPSDHRRGDRAPRDGRCAP